MLPDDETSQSYPLGTVEEQFQKGHLKNREREL